MMKIIGKIVLITSLKCDIIYLDIPNQPNSIKGKELKDKLNSFKNINYQESIQDAIRSIPVKENDIILITGSLYLAGEVLNLN